MTDTATVETLTAEVRVLMVGNRQITLSVYRQLDEFDPYCWPIEGNFTAFGRVNSGTKYDSFDRKLRPCKREAICEFIGRDENDGSLKRLVVLPFDMGDDGFEGEDKPIISRWKDELPLIVLAGLR